MIDEIKMAFPSLALLVVAAVALVLGLIFGKEKRKLFLIPSIIITAVIVNPLFYNFWYKFNSRAYWRTLWIIPVVCLCAFVPALLVEKTKKNISKTAVVMLGTAAIVFFGVFVYTGDKFVEADNADKLPNDVVAVAEALLELDDEPYVVADASLSRYLRQYSGKIKTLYGRDVDWYISSQQARVAYQNLYEDLEIVAQTMVDYDYDYLVTNDTDIERQRLLNNAGFRGIAQIGKFGIYCVQKKKTIIREYDDRHQVISLTYIDEEGMPINTPRGYAKIIYKYDEYGRVVYEYHMDMEGNGVIDQIGKAGSIKKYDRRGLVTEEAFLNEEAELKQEGFSLIEYKYDENKNLVEELYEDSDGRLINIDIGYAKKVNVYSNNELILTYFYDGDGTMLKCGSGYFHQFLTNLKGTQKIMFFSIKDEGTYSLNETLQRDLTELGIQSILLGRYRCGFCAVVSPESVTEKIGDEAISLSGRVDGLEYTVLSAGYDSGNESSIVINGVEFSMNERGINIVIVEDGRIVDSVVFDTLSPVMEMKRSGKFDHDY